MKKELNILFYVAYPYYFPHFLPIGKVFKAEGHHVSYILSDKQNSENMEEIAQENDLDYTFGEESLFSADVDVVFFAKPFEEAKDIAAMTVFLEHGIGTKSTTFFSSVEYFDMYLVEGDQKYNRLKELYPQFEYKLAKVGFSKFDEIVHFPKEEEKKIFEKYALDKKKKTILYAPTFFPSSIEKMADDFPSEFSDCNILVKPHYLSYERKKYKNQIKKFKVWEGYENCTVLPLSEYNLVPFMAISDVMISDESSAMFEFASLNKPVISNQYFKLRWAYYLMPWRLGKRIDSSKESYRTILDNANSYEDTLKYTKEALVNPHKLESERLKFSKDLCGEIDGKVSDRIYEAALKKLKKKSNR